MPVTVLKTVVLPAPLGPMTEKMAPRSTLRSSPSTARRPPKRTVRLLISSKAMFVSCQRSAEQPETQARDSLIARRGLAGGGVGLASGAGAEDLACAAG